MGVLYFFIIFFYYILYFVKPAVAGLNVFGQLRFLASHEAESS
jgi:hypothetical protein